MIKYKMYVNVTSTFPRLLVFYLCVCIELAIIQHEGFFLHPYCLLASITSQTHLLMRTFLYVCSHAFICVASGNYSISEKNKTW